MFNTISKIILLGFYILVPAAFFIESLRTYADAMLIVMVVLFALHLLEFVLVKNKLATIPGGMAAHFMMTFLFGFTYWKPLFKSQAETIE